MTFYKQRLRRRTDGVFMVDTFILGFRVARRCATKCDFHKLAKWHYFDLTKENTK